ncbi:MAG TPA: hypothetical protein VM346_01200 [Sphingomicrobium sp.]|nr:hypothetical protein [Sphingomicrobium sp.]
MRTLRPVAAIDPRDFGKRPHFITAEYSGQRAFLSDDAKLFATTFASGFLFVFLLIA